MFIKHLRLQNFRRFKDYTLELDPKLTVIVGDNAKGKSTLLEALYYITNLKSPFANKLKTLVNFNEQEYFRLEALVDNGVEEFKLAVFYDLDSPQIQINGKIVNSDIYMKKTRSILFSAEYIDRLMLAPSERRDFFDTIAYIVDWEYAVKIKKFNKILRQRNSRLKQIAESFYDTNKLNLNDTQLEFWNQQFVKHSSWIVEKRLELERMINELDSEFSLKYMSDVNLGGLESMIDIESIEELYESMVESNIKKDVFRGYTTFGAQRDDWAIILNKDAIFNESTDIRIAEFGSRGQKRYAISKLIFSIQELNRKYLEEYPLLLLDDIFSELDKTRFTKLLNHDIINKQQTVISSVTENQWIKDLNLSSDQIVKL